MHFKVAVRISKQVVPSMFSGQTSTCNNHRTSHAVSNVYKHSVTGSGREKYSRRYKDTCIHRSLYMRSSHLSATLA